MLLSLASTAMVIVVGQLALVAVWMSEPFVNGQPPSEIVTESLVMMKLGMFWLLGEFGVMVKLQVFCSVFVDRVSVPFLGVVSDEAFAGGLPVLALATSTSVEACFSSLFRADSLADLVMPL